MARRKRVRMGLLGMMVLLVTGGLSLRAAEVPREEIRKTIEEGCRRIISTQQEDGMFVLDRFFVERSSKSLYGFPVGMTSLGVLALQHALPHLRGQRSIQAREAIQKGLAFITQQPPEKLTYSAGMAICALYTDNPKRNAQLISQYATMLVISQIKEEGPEKGQWSYQLHPLPPDKPGKDALFDINKSGGDHSNDQYAVLGLLHAQLAGFQIPAHVWEDLRQHYISSIKPQGGWNYDRDPYGTAVSANMTMACTISLKICEEMLFAGDHKPCKPIPENPAVTKALEWLGQRLDYTGLETYGMYSTERLGILSGLSEIGQKPWFDEIAKILVRQATLPFGGWISQAVPDPNQQVGAAFAVLFLSRGLEPIIINKLKRKGTEDWNNDCYDAKHLVEYVSTRFQIPKQWRVVSLDVDVEFLKRVPILFISGHDPLTFTPEEKAKLKAYVAGGGTIFGMACCGRKQFGDSFLELVKELWPEGEMVDLPKTHPIYTEPRPTTEKPKFTGMAMANQEGRLGVIFTPVDLCCRWQVGGARATGAFEVGANLTFYVEKMHKAFLAAAAQPTPTTEPQAEPATSEPAILGP